MYYVLRYEDLLFEFIQYGLSNPLHVDIIKSIFNDYNFLTKYSELLKEEGITLNTTEVDDIVEINYIGVSKDTGRTGIGSSILRTLIEWADESDKILTLVPVGGSRISRTRLIQWYSKFGFIVNKGDNEREGLLYMYRDPQFQLV